METIKVTNLDGVRVVRHGVKVSALSEVEPGRKPPWLKRRLPDASGPWARVRERVHSHGLHTVCEEAMCPNLPECWSRGTATFMLLGSACTRACRFCAVDTGNPRGKLNAAEPLETAKAVQLMQLKYLVLTSVNRDDLADGGAGHFAQTIRQVLKLNPDVAVEALTPDFAGNLEAVLAVVDSGLLVFAHNIETVERLTGRVRDPRATYRQSLRVLEHAAGQSAEVIVKSGMMLGLGESDDEITRAMDDLRTAGVRILTLGQYLRPTRNHLPVERWVRPDEFEQYRLWALEKGFESVASGPLVRSSYRAEEALGLALSTAEQEGSGGD